MCLKNPSWYDSSDRELYYKMLYSKDPKPMNEYSQTERDFVTSMYHQEEYYAYGEL